MAVLRLDHVSVVVEDLPAAVTFFRELGLELEGEASMSGDWIDRINAIAGLEVDIAMMRTPDGLGRLELTRFRSPAAVGSAGPVNAVGLRSVMFAVDDVDAVVAHMLQHGGELVGEVVQYGQSYRLCYLRGPEGVIVSLAQELVDA